MDLGPPALLDQWNASEALLPGNILDKGVEHPEDFFCHNPSEKLPPEDLDLEKQNTVPEDTKASWWRRIWGRIFSLIFKTETPATLPRVESNLSSASNTRVHSYRPTIETIETVRETNLVGRGPTQAKPDSESPTFEKMIRARSRLPPPPPPTSDTLHPCQGGLLSRGELGDLILLIESAGYNSPPISSFDGSTARKRDSTTIPPSMYHPHPD